MAARYSESEWLRGECPEHSARLVQHDQEFWDQVNRNLGLVPGPELVDLADDADQDRLDAISQRAQSDQTCPVCGSETVCAYDAQGQALVHAVDEAEL